ncbi:MAG: 2-phospho-L-lactate guanylyltransferase [Thermomicrobium sp.]
MRTLAVVPIQKLEQAKSRLASALEPAKRQSLVLELGRQTIEALRSVPDVAEVLVVTPDPQVAAAGARWGARPLLQTQPGLNRAIRSAQRVALRAGYAALLVVLGDLPLLGARQVQAALALLEPRGIVLAPDRRGTGTNLLALAPPNVIAPAFGPESRRHHRLAAVRARCTLRELWALPLAFDLDIPDDLVDVRLVTRGEGGK